MRFSTTRLFPLGLMLVLALLTFWLDRAVRDEPSHPSQRRHDPDYLVHDFASTSYNRLGSIETTITAAKMLHYPDDDSTELISPRVVQEKPTQPRFTVRADRGVLAREGDEILLYDNVLLVREPDEGHPGTRMTTSFLHVLRDRSIVRTDREVTIVEGRRSLTGRGMEYDNESRALLLRHDVTARIEAEKR
jgi:lipopolysaccharide export system protein LptC